MALKQKDFSYYKDFITDGINTHRVQMLQKNLPKDVIGAYEGFLGNFEDETQISGYYDHQEPTQSGHLGLGNDNSPVGELIENHLFIAVNTLLPSLFFQVPRPIIRANAGGSSFSAEILNGMARHYFDERAKKENQKAIIDAFLPYGFGCIKVGYNSRRGKTVSQKPNLFTGETKGEKVKEGMEAHDEFLKYENAYIERVSPRDTILDHTKPFGKGNCVTFLYTRTLQELMDSNLYPLTTEFINHFKVKGDNDARKVRIRIREHWTLKNNFAWKLVYTEDWPEPLIWGQSVYTELPYSLLRFNEASDVLYPIAHGSLAYRAQKELNYLNELWKQNIDHSRSQTLVFDGALAEGGRKTLEENEYGGIIYTDRPVTQGVSQPIGSPPLPAEIFANISNTRAYLNLLISTTGGKTDEPDTKLATTERAKAMGDVLRQSGLADNIRDFFNDQMKKVLKSVIRYGDPDITVKITGKDVIDPKTGEQITGKFLSIGGDDGLTLKQEIQGKVESDYRYDVDIASAARPDFAVIRKQVNEYISSAAQLRPLLQEKGMDFEWEEIFKAYGQTFTALPNSENWIREMTKEEKQAFAQAQAMAQQQEAMKNASKGNPSPPTEAAIIQGAGAVPSGQAGIPGV